MMSLRRNSVRVVIMMFSYFFPLEIKGWCFPFEIKVFVRKLGIELLPLVSFGNGTSGNVRHALFGLTKE